ncbi:hypothetical protein HNQ34_000891 [Anoxybacillus tepidamans]|uniref:Copper amine oxidase-like N-terminal domain-containing protein n=1 Tax=Anoxybacteroides tepidamans TaxID=265948 RepID=A0A7W8IQC3_9BACL|nr:hypothetical protein [Anoxybacillus tepidamans]MBB5323799.1 hypothetical protein [Anoxybacillus tepidamans]
MMRTAILMIALFLGISGGAMYMQWRDYEQTNNRNGATPLVHTIDIRHVGKQLEITQTIEGLTERSYEVMIPSGAKQMTYIIGNKRQTLAYERNGKSSVQVGGNNRISFRYVISLPSLKTIWLERWSVVVFSKQPQQFRVQLIDYATKNGMWMAGAPLDGRIKKDSFTLYSWSQKNLLSFPLYFQPAELSRNVYGSIEVYGQNKANMKATKWADVPSFTLVLSPWGDQHLSPTLVVVPETTSLSSIQAEYMRTYYASYFLPSGEINEWVADLLTAIALQTQPVTPQAKAVWQQFQEKLTEDEKKAFLSFVLQYRGKMLTPSMLDKALSASRTGETTYFTDLMKKGRSLLLIFTNEGNVYVNDVPLKEAKAVLQNGEILLPFTEVMSRLRYDVRRSGDAVFIENNDNRWRFFVNSSVYMQGNDRFGAPSIIIRDINGMLYMSTDIIQRWFSVQVWTTDRDVYVKAVP